MGLKKKSKVNYDTDIILGERYLDKQTGIRGVATSIHFYQHGCERVTIETMVEGALKEYTFDSPRLTNVNTGETATTNKTGGPEKASDPGRSTGDRA
ncbi:gp075 [Rhodococcus phage ReqiDocB7]|uniref:gp075 n=1 Tax=Rhodococcus phage ReqiDocB7 TaxID=691966 RepID=UPI0001CDD864|nr:gp075 [Rhodococcus phage ReqiDocB7]ADD80861.1 gp075 [Rhodococcus phage ReqiDocB7]